MLASVLLFTACGGGSPFIINLPPIIDFKVTPSSGFSPLTVTLDASLTIDPGGEVVSFSFDWTDDGIYDYTESATRRPDGVFDGKTTHAYTTPGTYYARVKAADDQGDDSISPREQITVNNPAPLARISADVTQGAIPLTVRFSGANSTGQISTYEWDFNWDTIPANFNVAATGVSVSYLYQALGQYFAALRVKDAAGNPSIDSVNITVDPPPNLPPTAGARASTDGVNYSTGPLTVALNQLVYFEGSGSDPDGGSVSFLWDFNETVGGQPRQSPSQSPIYTFQDPGPHTVRLRVTDDENTFTDAALTVTVTV